MKAIKNMILFHNRASNGKPLYSERGNFSDNLGQNITKQRKWYINTHAKLKQNKFVNVKNGKFVWLEIKHFLKKKHCVAVNFVYSHWIIGKLFYLNFYRVCLQCTHSTK